MSDHFNDDWGFASFLLISSLFIFYLVPCFIKAGRPRLVASILAVVFSTILWIYYELYLSAIAKPGDPLIRLDLMIILPLQLVIWLSAIYRAMAARFRTAKEAEQDAAANP